MPTRADPVIALKRGYCIFCLRDLGITFDESQLAVLEEFGLFPKRVGPLVWDAEEVDAWLERRDGSRPTPPTCH